MGVELKRLIKVNVAAPTSQVPNPRPDTQTRENLLRGNKTPHVAIKQGRINSMISMFEPRLDSGTIEEDVRTTRYRHPSDNDRGLEPSYIVKDCDNKKQEDVDFKSEVKFIFEDNQKEDVQVLRRGPKVRSWEEEEIHGGTEDSYAAV